MPTISPTFYVLLFCFTIVATYIVARMNWFRVRVTLAAGLVANVLAFFLFATARGSSVGHALTVGLLLGGIFTALSLALGRMFGKFASVVEVAEKMPSAEAVQA